jgi:hypothetical protein
MAISTTTILGQDNPSQSRVTINNNFDIIINAINSLAGNINYTTGLATLNGITINLPTNATPITASIFSCAASGSFIGNLTIGEVLNAKGGYFNGSGVISDGGDITVLQPTNSIISKGALEIEKKIKLKYSTLLDSTAYSALTSGQFAPDSYIVNLTCTGNLTLLAGEEGQILKLYMNTAGPVNIQTTNLASIIASPIILNSKGQVLEL